jgi:hypothetical protein
MRRRQIQRLSLQEAADSIRDVDHFATLADLKSRDDGKRETSLASTIQREATVAAYDGPDRHHKRGATDDR